MELNKYIDHTLLSPTTTPADIEQLCLEAKTHQFYAVCVNGCYVPLAKSKLKGSGVKLAATVGFPLGAASPEAKVREAEIALAHGADEIDMVMNLGFLKGDWPNAFRQEIEEIKHAIGSKVLKVILEICNLTDDEIRIACWAAKEAGADFVKTSTGFGSGGATENAVKIMVQEVGDTMKIKASGGIRDAKTAKKYIKLGVNRIGTSSGIAIVTDAKQDTE